VAIYLLVLVHSIGCHIRVLTSVGFNITYAYMYADILFRVLPETLRAIVGDGSVPPPRLYRTPLALIKGSQITPSSSRPPKKPFQNPFLLFTYPDVVTLLVFNAIVNAVFYGVLASLSSLFADDYPFLSETDLGLCFLAIGGGMIFGSVVTGRLMDRDYSVTREKMVQERMRDTEKSSEEAEVRKEVVREENFPIEVARLRSSPIYLTILTACVVGYGWCLEKRVSIAGPLILQFISESSTMPASLRTYKRVVGYSVVAFMNTSQTLLIDLMPNRGSSVTAAVSVGFTYRE
jgi:MFS family permease